MNAELFTHEQQQSNKELLEWIEKQASTNLNYRLQSFESLAKDANSLLNIMFAAIGAIVAFCIKHNPTGINDGLLVASLMLLVWLMAVAFLLVFKCIMTSEFLPPGNEPRHLKVDGYSFESIRTYELENVQFSIDCIVKVIERMAFWLDKVRFLMILSPLIFILAYAFHAYLQAIYG